MSKTAEQGYCATCRHMEIRKQGLTKGLLTRDWQMPCRDCDINTDYRWEPKP